MPSRLEHHDSFTGSTEQKNSPPTPRQSSEATSRHRSRRTRVTSGNGATETQHCPEECGHHRARRTSTVAAGAVCGSSSTRNSKQYSKSPSSLPSSPNESRSLLDPTHHTTTLILDTYAPQSDVPGINRVDQLEDENSFSSSVFSEHLTSSDLPLVINSVQEEALKLHRGSLLSPSGHRITHDQDHCPDDSQSDLTKELKADMDGLLIHGDTEVSTPAPATTDDAASSEGEDEKDSGLMPSAAVLRLSDDHMQEENVVSVGHSSLLPSSCLPTECDFTVKELSALNHGTYDRARVDRSQDVLDVNLQSRLLGESPPKPYSPNLTPPSHQRIATSISSNAVCSNSSRVTTRSHAAVFPRHDLAPVSPSLNRSCPDCCLCDSQAPHHPDRACLCSSVHRTYGSPVTITRESTVSGGHPSLAGAVPPFTLLVSAASSTNCDTFPLDPSHTVNPYDSEPPLRCQVSVGTEVKFDNHPVVLSPPRTSASSHPYPLRSRLRRDLLRQQWRAAQNAPKSFAQLPIEVVFRIAHYLSIQDVFRLQLINRRFKAIVERYLLLVKRINFSNGLPFAFLPESINDASLKRILSRTPEVTHILGFYPKCIYGSHPMDYHSLGNNRSGPPNALTYAGIVSAFRVCTRLRSVELMDVELMSKLVHFLPRIKFHGMFRNRPDSWDCEYAVPLPAETHPLFQSETPDLPNVSQSPSSSVLQPSVTQDLTSDGTVVPSRSPSALFSAVAAISAAFSPGPKSKPDKFLSSFDFRRLRNKILPLSSRSSCGSPSKNSALSLLARQAAIDAHNVASRYVDFSVWFDPIGETPIGYGSPSSVPHFLPPRTIFSANPGSCDTLRSVVTASFLQHNLPPLEAELISSPMNNQRPAAESPHIIGQANYHLTNNHAPIIALAFGAVFVSPHLFNRGLAPPLLLAPPGLGADGMVVINQLQYHDRLNPFPFIRGHNQPPARPAIQEPNVPESHPSPLRPARRQVARQYGRMTSNTIPTGLGRNTWLVSPLPGFANWIGLPHAISNLTKLDLVSVSISALPRLDNIKYLHLKWVVFTSTDPFLDFSASKLQSFVMNNCYGPARVVRFVRIFSALARAPQLARLELVGIPFVDGLLTHLIDVPLLPNRSFRNLQRLVLSSNKDSSELDVGLLLLAGQQSLNHIAIQVAHTRNSLFESLLCAHATFPRLDYLILGYQDPYQSRLSVSELHSLGLGHSSDLLMPACSLTDRGLAIMLHLSPRLTYLTVRHAPYLTSPLHWHYSSYLMASVDSSEDQSSSEQAGSSDSTEASPGHPNLQSFTLRSLTLENCPAIQVETLESTISMGAPFPYLETLVLRDMLLPRHRNAPSLLPKPTWQEHQKKLAQIPEGFEFDPDPLLEVDWRRLGHLLAISDLLMEKRLGYSPLCSDGIGLASSVREVTLPAAPPGLHNVDIPLKPFGLFYSLRLHHYMNSLLEMDGSCGQYSTENGRIRSVLLYPNKPTEALRIKPPNVAHQPANFVSRSTQTCVCGLLEWHLHQRILAGSDELSVVACSDTSSTRNESNVQPRSPRQLGGSLAFHPYPASGHHQELHDVITGSEWTECLLGHSALTTLLASNSRFIHVNPDECFGCSSEPSVLSFRVHLISDTKPELDYVHRTRKWLARDASVDTSTLRCCAVCEPQVFTVFQPVGTVYGNLTTLHFEKVGITHMVLCGAPHLKNITLENCTQLQAVLFHSPDQAVPTYDSLLPDVCPCLRRIRIIRCPRFAIYNLLHSVASLYPAHDENISITYRPFGRYNEQLERALWCRAQYAHVLVSHDYKLHESEREMEEFHSTFDQLFREVINFSEMLVRRDLLSVNPKPNGCPNSLKSSPFRRSEHGSDWDIVTDIPWIHEICCSILRNSDTRRSDQADQFYEILSEIQSVPGQMKIQRRGIHFHVQYRDVHERFVAGSENVIDDNDLSYLNHPYTENYLASTHPRVDVNAWDDGLDKSVASSLPPFPTRPPSSQSNQLLWQRILLAQDSVDRVSNSLKSHSALKRPRDCPSVSGISHSSAKIIRLDAHGAMLPTPRKHGYPKSADSTAPKKRQSSVSSLKHTACKRSRCTQQNQSTSS